MGANDRKRSARCYAGEAFRTRPVSCRCLAVVATLRLCLDGLDAAPFDPLPPAAGILAGMRPAFVVGVLAPLALVTLATWCAAFAG